MELSGIAPKRGAAPARRTAPRREWALSDALREQISALAREDAAKGVYMGEAFLSLRRKEVAKAAPDRAALMAKLDTGNREVLAKIREADERWLRLWFGREVRLERQGDGGPGSALHLYDQNGDEILTCTAGVGWQQKESRAETAAHGAIKAAYYDAWHAAREQPAPGGLDTKA